MVSMASSVVSAGSCRATIFPLIGLMRWRVCMGTEIVLFRSTFSYSIDIVRSKGRLSTVCKLVVAETDGPNELETYVGDGWCTWV